MERLAGLISNIEFSIRYLLSGVVVYAIYLLGLTQPSSQIAWIEAHPGLAGFIAASIGFVAYSLYRITFWIIGDWIAWKLGLSAPSLEPGKFYDGPYSSFLLWRRKHGFDEPLNGYLHYRWAVVHFCYIVGFALSFALFYREPKSLIDLWFGEVGVTCVLVFGAAVWQSSFLFRVERELYSRARRDAELAK
ncbi:hypothetical protein D9M69_482760 [compost metagenome]